MSAEALVRLLAVYAEVAEAAAAADPDTDRATALLAEADGLVGALGPADPALRALASEVDAARQSALAAIQAAQARLRRDAARELGAGGGLRAYAAPASPEARFLDRRS